MADKQPPYFPPYGHSPAEKRQKAVALEYDAEKQTPPRVTASGQGHLAEQILQIAFAHGVKVREDADLVEILSVLDIDSAIPVEAFAAVGEILSYVYRANARAGKQLPPSAPLWSAEGSPTETTDTPTQHASGAQHDDQ